MLSVGLSRLAARGGIGRGPRAGDVANVVSLCVAFAFVAAIALRPSLFAASYMSAGFCVSFVGTPFNSHVLCFCVDAVATLALVVLCVRRPGTRGLDRVRESMWGVLGHGVGHLAIHTAGGGAVGVTPGVCAALVFFWYLLLRPLSRSRALVCAMSLAHSTALMTFVPPVFAFTYVQTVLITAFVGRDLAAAARKDAHYDAWSWCVNVPVVLAGWLEALACDYGLIAIGGHVLYDAVIPLSMLVYAGIALSRGEERKAA